MTFKICFPFLLLSICFFHQIKGQTDSLPYPGEFVGSHTVNLDGSASYTFPLWVPKGRAGMQPELSISYNSRRGNGWLGLGWAVSGFSEIRLCKRTIAQDGFLKGITFEPVKDAALCLNGNRLIKITDYEDGRTEFRTEKRVFSKIIYDPSKDAFTVWLKNGRILTYGGREDAIYKIFNGQQLAWALVEAKDRFENYISYEYDQPSYGERYDDGVDLLPFLQRVDPDVCDVTGFLGKRLGSDYYPKRISYTGNHSTNMVPTRTIEFIYKDRPDKIMGYYAGIPMGKASILDSIKIITDTGRIVRSYLFDYANEGRSELSKLVSITECGDFSRCKPPTTFEWSLGDQGYELLADVFPSLSLPYENDYAFALDLDGDGFDEVIVGKTSGTGQYTRFNFEILRKQAEGITLTRTYELTTSTASGTLSPLIPVANPIPIDYDQDGKLELLLPRVCSPSSNLGSMGVYECTDPEIYMYIVDLDEVLDNPDASPSFPYTLEADRTPILADYSASMARTYVGDFDGDGEHEVVRYNHNNWEWELWETSIGRAASSLISQIPFQNGPPRAFTMDFNGDGATDLLVENRGSGSFMVVSFTNGTITYRDTYMPNYYVLRSFSDYQDHTKNPAKTPDANGDGLRDVVVPGTGGRITTYINTGKYLVRRNILQIPGFNARGLSQAQIIDYNLDGRDDLLLPLIPEATYSAGTVDGFFPRIRSDGSISFYPWSVLISTDTGFEIEETDIWYYKYWTDGPAYHPLIPLEWDGDGMKDIFAIYLSGTTTAWRIRKQKGEYPDMLTSVRQGLNPVSQSGQENYPPNVSFHYAPSTDTMVYEKGSDVQDLSIRNLRGLIHLVDTLSIMNGRPNESLHTRFFYKDGKLDIKGRGWLGFSKRITHFPDGKVLEEEFDPVFRIPEMHIYPFKGQPVRMTSTFPIENNGLASRKNETLFFRGYRLFHENRSYFTYIDSLRQSVSEVYGGNNELELSVMLQQNQFDNFGNQLLNYSHLSTKNFTPDTLLQDSLLANRIASEESGLEITVSRTYDVLEEEWLTGLLRREEYRLNRPVNMPYWEQKISNAGIGTDSQIERLRSIIIQRHSKSLSLDYYDNGTLKELISQPDSENGSLSHRFEYDEMGNVLKIESKGSARANGQFARRIRRYEFDPETFTFITSIQEKLNANKWHFTRLSHDSGLGTPVSITDPNDLITTRSYDAFGQLIQEIYPDQSKVNIAYSSPLLQNDASINPGRSIPALSIDMRESAGQNKTKYFDRLGRQQYSSARVFQDSILYKFWEYDSLGRLSRNSLPSYSTQPDQWITFGFDPAHRIRSINGRNGLQAINYDGLVSRSTNALGVSNIAIKNSLEELICTVDGLGSLTQFYYDQPNILSKIIDPLGNQSLMLSDAFGRQVLLEDPDFGLNLTFYNAYGEVITTVDAAKQAVQFEYDLLGRPVREMRPDGNFRYFYDSAMGRGEGKIARIRSRSARHEENFEYDDLGRLINKTLVFRNEPYQYQYTYDDFSRLDQIRYPAPNNLTVAYDYAPQGELIKVYNPSDNYVWWELESRNADGLNTLEKLGNGIRTNHIYHSSGRMEEMTVFGEYPNAETRDTLIRLGFNYDIIGHLSSKTNFTENLKYNYSYDPLDRLIRVDEINTNSTATTLLEEVTYNRIGNITRRLNQGNYIYHPQKIHAVTQAGNLNFEYDANGNQINRNGLSISYTSFDQPSIIRDSLQNLIGTFKYDAFQQRIQKNLIGTRHRYIGNLTEQINSGWEEIFKSYISNGQKIVAVQIHRQSRNTPARISTIYPHIDERGSPLIITNSLGNIIERRRYDPFGKLLSPEAPQSKAVSIGYDGHEDEPLLGWINMGGRMYDPEIARFTSPDPLLQFPFFSQGLNRYSFVLNNPISNSEVNGFEMEEEYEGLGMLSISKTIDSPTSDDIPDSDIKSNSERKAAANSDGSGSPVEDIDSEGSNEDENDEFVFQTYNDLREAQEVFGAITEGDDPYPILNWTPIASFIYDFYRTDQQIENISALKDQSETQSEYIFWENLAKKQVREFWGLQSAWAAVSGLIAAAKVPKGRKVNAKLWEGRGATGDLGENYLKLLGGKQQVFFKTPFGGRFIDRLAGGIAHEAKVGRTAASKFVKIQLMKDIHLLKNKEVKEVIWNFFISPKTGKSGPTRNLEKLFEKYQKEGFNIRYVIHELDVR